MSPITQTAFEKGKQPAKGERRGVRFNWPGFLDWLVADGNYYTIGELMGKHLPEGEPSIISGFLVDPEDGRNIRYQQIRQRLMSYVGKLKLSARYVDGKVYYGAFIPPATAKPSKGKKT